MNKPAFLEKIEFVDRIKEFTSEKWEGLSSRDRYLLVGMIIIIILVSLYLGFKVINTNIERQMAETENYRKALQYLSENQQQYRENTTQKEAMRQRLLAADAKVVSKLTSMASTLGFDVTVTPKDPRKTSDDSGAEEQEIEVTLKNVDYQKCLEYIVQIHKLDTPIYMRHLNLNRSSNVNNPDTKMTVSITLISYRLKEQNAT